MTCLKHSLIAVVILGTVACDAGINVDELPIGAEVVVTRQDGAVVEGTLAQRDATVVKINRGQAVREVSREQIADVQLVQPDAPVELPEAARFREYTVPADTPLTVTLSTAVNSKTSAVSDTIEAVLKESVVIEGENVVPAGTRLEGVVTAVEPSGKVKGRASLTIEFRTMTIAGHDAPYTIAATRRFAAQGTKKDDAAKIGVPAVGGAVLGGMIGGKKGAVIGGILGAGAGTAVVLTTPGEEVVLADGTTMVLALERPVEIRVPIVRR